MIGFGCCWATIEGKLTGLCACWWREGRVSMKRGLLASVSMAALTVAASAADVPAPVYKAPAAPPAWSWTGFYVGVNGGVVRYRARAEVTDAIPNFDFSTVNATSGTF